MPKPQERRAIEHFIRQYNQFGDPKITHCQAENYQESPDAILTLSTQQQVALEHTSAFPPKQSHVKYLSPLDDPSPITRVLERKFLNSYRGEGHDLTWLLMQIRPTMPLEKVTELIERNTVPKHFDALFLQWPVLLAPGHTSLGLFEVRQQQLWLPRQTAA
jgi:hypothetical protein